MTTQLHTKVYKIDTAVLRVPPLVWVTGFSNECDCWCPSFYVFSSLAGVTQSINTFIKRKKSPLIMPETCSGYHDSEVRVSIS